MSAEDVSNALPTATMAQLIADIAQAVDLNIPAPGEKTLFFERQLVERVKHNVKSARKFGVVENAFRVIQGR